MSIKEALERQPASRPTTKTDRLYQPVDEKTLTEEGIRVLKEAGVSPLLDELVEIIKREFSDVHIFPDPDTNHDPRVEIPIEDKRYGLVAGGTVMTGISWNFRDSSHPSNLGGHETSYVIVHARPLSQELVVEGKKYEIIPKSVWSSPDGKTILEDAIVEAYKNPGTFFDRPHRPYMRSVIRGASLRG